MSNCIIFKIINYFFLKFVSGRKRSPLRLIKMAVATERIAHVKKRILLGAAYQQNKILVLKLELLRMDHRLLKRLNLLNFFTKTFSPVSYEFEKTTASRT